MFQILSGALFTASRVKPQDTSDKAAPSKR